MHAQGLHATHHSTITVPSQGLHATHHSAMRTMRIMTTTSSTMMCQANAEPPAQFQRLTHIPYDAPHMTCDASHVWGAHLASTSADSASSCRCRAAGLRPCTEATKQARRRSSGARARSSCRGGEAWGAQGGRGMHAHRNLAPAAACAACADRLAATYTLVRDEAHHHHGRAGGLRLY